MNGPPAAFVARLFEEQFRAVVQAVGAIFFRGVAGEDDLEDVGILALEQAEEFVTELRQYASQSVLEETKVW